MTSDMTPATVSGMAGSQVRGLALDDGDSLPFEPDESQSNLVVVEREPRKCKRHIWMVEQQTGHKYCNWCGKHYDATLIRRGKNNRARGNSIERKVAKTLGARRTGQYGGKDDVTSDLFHFQVKSKQTASFPGWMTVELDALRSQRSGKEPVLVVAEAPGPGRKARRLYVVDESTWLALHGTPRGGEE